MRTHRQCRPDLPPRFFKQALGLLKQLWRGPSRHPSRRPLPRSWHFEELEGRRLLSTFTVINSNDSGPGSLRQAIFNANSTAGLNQIDFAIGSGVQTIKPTSALPAITNPVIIDGTTQPGFTGTPIIVLDGSLAGVAKGLTISAGNSTVRDLVINQFSSGGIYITGAGATNDRVEGNYIGTDVSGTMALGNQGNAGVAVDAGASNNIIGGTTAGARNVISGNSGSGVEINTASGNLVEGNFIGTDATGTLALGNAAYGVNLNTVFPNTIGGTAAGSGNVISGNTQGGIAITDPSSFLVSEVNAARRVDSQTGALVTTYSTPAVSSGAAIYGPDGSVYVTDYYNNQVNHYDANGTFLFSFGAGRLSNPQAMILGPDGNLYVGDVAGSVQEFSLAGTFLRTFVAAGSGGLSNTKGLAFGPDGNFYVASWGTDSVVRYNGTTGAFLNTFVSSGSGGLSSPEGIAFGPDGNLYVSSYNTNSVLRYQGTNGAFLGAFVSSGIVNPYGLCFDPAGNLEVVDQGNGQVKLYQGQTGAFLRVLASGLNTANYLTTVPANVVQGNVIQGNSIGTNASGSAGLPNLLGVILFGSSANNLIGGTVAGAGNTIAYNTGKGVIISGGTGNAIEGNAIFANGGLGIDLGNDGVTPNTGTKNYALPNFGMNFPVFTSAVLNGTTLTVTGYVGTAAGQATFAGARVEIFKATNDPSGQGQGQTYLGFLVADGSGNLSGSLTVSGLNPGDQITATATDGSNNSSEFAANVALNPSATTVVSSANPSVYGQAVTFTATVSAVAPPGTPTGTVTFRDGVVILATVTLSGGTATFVTSTLSAGSHSITVSYSGDTVYASSTSTPLTQTVTPATLTVTANNATKVYGQANPAFSDVITGFVNGDTAAVVSGSASLTTTATASSGVGSYTITAAQGSLSAANYTFAFANGTLSITPATLTVTANNATKVYGQANPAFSDVLTGFVNGDTAAVVSGSAGLTTTATASSGVGSYTITVAQGSLSAANYTFAFANGTLTVTAATLTVTANNATKVYGQANPAFSDVLTGFVNGDTAAVVSGSASLTTTATANSGVGSYTITAAQGSLSAANYTFAFVSGTLSITPATLTVTANNATKVYGQANPAFSDVLTGFVNGDTAAVVSGSASLTTTATASSGVGSYTITAAQGSLSAANYTFAFANATLTVTPATLTVTANNATKVYGQANPAFSDTITGFVNGDTAAVVSGSASLTTTATASSGVGSYTITAAQGSLSAVSYTFAFVNGTLTVTPATLTVTANNATKVYGQANPAFSDVITGFVNGDTAAVVSGSASLTTTATASSGVGSYTITAAQGSLSAANYTFAFVSGTLTITPAALTVTANDASKVYGQVNPAFSVFYTGFVNGDNASSLGGSLSFSTAAGPGSPVGTYAIAVTGLTSSNYAIAFVDGTLTITPAPLTIAGSDPTNVHGGDDQVQRPSRRTEDNPPSTRTITPGGLTLIANAMPPIEGSGNLPIGVSGSGTMNPAPTSAPAAPLNLIVSTILPGSPRIGLGRDVPMPEATPQNRTSAADAAPERPMDILVGPPAPAAAPSDPPMSTSPPVPAVARKTPVSLPSMVVTPPQPPADVRVPSITATLPEPKPVLPNRLEALQKRMAQQTHLLHEEADNFAEEAPPWAKAVTAFFATTAAASAGYALFSGRAAAWALSLLMARPLWKQFDPMEILFAWETEKEERKRQGLPADEEDESLQALVSS